MPAEAAGYLRGCAEGQHGDHQSSSTKRGEATANIAEEVVVHKTVTDRTETIRETVRKEQVEVIKDDPVAARRG